MTLKQIIQTELVEKFPDFSKFEPEEQTKIKNRIYHRCWSRENKDKRRISNAKCYVKNREKYKMLSKVWKNNNTDYLESQRNYQRKRRREKGRPVRQKPNSIECDCGGFYLPKNKKQHLKTKKHIKYLSLE